MIMHAHTHTHKRIVVLYFKDHGGLSFPTTKSDQKLPASLYLHSVLGRYILKNKSAFIAN